MFATVRWRQRSLTRAVRRFRASLVCHAFVSPVRPPVVIVGIGSRRTIFESSFPDFHPMPTSGYAPSTLTTGVEAHALLATSTVAGGNLPFARSLRASALLVFSCAASHQERSERSAERSGPCSPSVAICSTMSFCMSLATCNSSTHAPTMSGADSRWRLLLRSSPTAGGAHCGQSTSSIPTRFTIHQEVMNTPNDFNQSPNHQRMERTGARRGLSVGREG